MRLVLTAAALAAGASLATAADRAPDAQRGEIAFQKCYACHALEPGRNDISGPTLHGIVGRRIAAEPGFDYSRALRGFAARQPRWSPQLLDRYIADPAAMVPGTAMTFAGMTSPAERADLIAFLRQQP